MSYFFAASVGIKGWSHGIESADAFSRLVT